MNYLSDVPAIEFHLPFESFHGSTEFEVRAFYSDGKPNCELVQKQPSQTEGEKSCFVIAYLEWGKDPYEGSDICIVGDRLDHLDDCGIEKDALYVFRMAKKAMDYLVIARYESEELRGSTNEC